MTWTKPTTAGRAERALERLLRVGVAGCFIGHGVFGVLGKEAWLPYFAVAGIGEELAWTLMPLVGTVDILVGIAALVSPRPAVLAYAAAWALWTALLRPLAGESVFEVLERAGNYGVPLAFLLLMVRRPRSVGEWLARVEPGRLVAARRRAVAAVLRGTTAALLVGHGALALLGKELLEGHLTWTGLPAGALPAVGLGEIGLGVAVAWHPGPALLFISLGWKLATEMLFPLTGAPVWEFVERAGSYVAPLALWAVVARAPHAADSVPRLGRARRSTVAAAALLFATLAAPLTPWSGAASAQVRLGGDRTLLAALREGGHVLACRHAITDHSRGDRRVDFSDRSTQRLLSAEGEAQSRRIGRILTRLRIPIGEVLTSPYFRTADSAELTFGRAQVSPALYSGGGEGRGAVRALLARPPRAGTNTALMTHQGILYPALPQVERGSIREGDCVVVRPTGEGRFRVVARLGPAEWDALDRSPRQEASGPVQRAIRAAEAGGTTIVCRHAITGDTRETEPVDYDDPTTQRLLSAEGERQSRLMGRAFRALGIRIPELIASPMQRARRTAELMFDREPVIDTVWHTNGGSYGGPPRDARLRALSAPVEDGNRLVVSHIGTISSVLLEAEGRVGEGDCLVVRPAGGRHEVLGIVPWRAWLREAGMEPGS